MSAHLASRDPETLISTSEELASALLFEDADITGRSLTISHSAPRRHVHSDRYRSRVTDRTYALVKGASARKMEASASVIRWFFQGRSSLEELILQLYYGHLSVSAVESIMRQVWGRVGGAAVLSELVPGIIHRLDAWLKRPIEKPYRYRLLHEVNVRYRRSIAEHSTTLVVVGGIDHDNGCDILDIAAVSIDPAESSEVLASKFAEGGSVGPTPIIADSGGTLAGAVRRGLPSCDVLQFYSEFERELFRGVAFPHRRWVSDLLANLKRSSGRKDARSIGNTLLQQLRSRGYPSLSETMEAKLAEHLHYYDHSEIWRAGLGKVEKKIGATLSQVREQARIIGPILDDQVLVWFTAAAFRRLARRGQGSPHLSRTER